MKIETVTMPAAEAATLLGVTPGRVYQLIRDGQLPAVRRGRRALIPRAAFITYVEQMNQQALGNLSPSSAQECPHV